VQELLSISGIDINLKDNAGKTALHLAVECGDHKSVQVLLDHGIDMEVIDNDNHTALYYAVSEEKEIQQALLLKRFEGRDATERDRIVTLLLRMFEWLNSSGVDEETLKRETNGGTILHLAMRYDCFDVLELCVDYLRRVSVADPLVIKDYAGQTALHLAAVAGQVDTTLMLLCYMTPEQVAVKDRAGKTAEALATERGHADIVRILKDFSTYGVGLIVAVHEDRVPLVQRLLQMPGIDVNAKDLKQSQTALHLAAAGNQIDMVLMLLCYMTPEQVAVEDGTGKTAQALATERGHEDIVRILKDFSSYGLILITAVHENHVLLVRKLLQMPGIDVNAKEPRQGQTALHRAVMGENLECVQALLSVDGIDITMVDSSSLKRTALYIATQRKQREIVKRLLTKGAGLRGTAANAFKADVERVVTTFQENTSDEIKAAVDLLNQFLHPVSADS
jgi:ankyrin repeat protein